MDDNNGFVKTLYRRCLFSSMLAILGSTLGQIVIAAVIGRVLGSGELSVIGVTLPVYYLYATAGALLGVGGTAVCARLMGQNRFGESRVAFTVVYLLMLAAAALLTAVMLIFSGRITTLLGVTPDMELYPKVKEYIKILSLGGVGIMSIYPAFNLLRLDGRNGATAVIFFVMSGVNILMSYYMVVVLDAGVLGAARATVLGAAAAGLLGAVLLFARSDNFHFALPGKPQPGEDKVRVRRLALDIMVSGSPSAAENMCILLRTVILNWILVASLHDMTALAAFKVTDSINGVAQIFIAGAAGSLLPFIGVFSSEKDTKSIRQLLVLGFKWGGVTIVVFTAVCLIFTRQTAGLFGMGEGAAFSAIRVFSLSLPLAGLNNILVCLYQANRGTAAANILTLGRSLLWMVLAAFILTPRMGAAGVWHSFWIAELLGLALTLPVSAYYRRKSRYLSRLFLLDTEAEEKGTYKSFSVPNRAESITESAAGISEFCEANDLSPKQTMAISLAIEEMLVIIGSYCFPKEETEQPMNVRILIYEDMIILRIRNGGKAFNPIAHYERQSAAGGDLAMTDMLGIKMILGLAETVDYRNTFGVNNITMIL
ncbi:MAG: MATE family efflux transporter [Oscillospiraceae bacterium]|nr:MATE family efflux transporter [Oscillospiraceae bacterium]